MTTISNEHYEEKPLSQQNEVNQTPSTLPTMNSPPLLLPQNSQINLNPNPSINPQATFSHFDPNHEHGVNLLASPTVPFPENSPHQFNFFDKSEYQNNLSFAQNLPPESMLTNPMASSFPGSHFLDFGSNSAYYCPEPVLENQTDFESSIVLP